MSYLSQIQAANNARLDQYQPLYHAQRLVGLLWRKQIPLLQEYGLRIRPSADGYTLDSEQDCPGLSAHLGEVINALRRHGHVPGWRNETYALSDGLHRPAVALIERAAMPLFGGCGYGVHVNGLTVRHGQIHLWIAQRARDKPTDPGKLDQIAAGGLPHGIDAFRNMQKECSEEAAIPSALSAHAKPVSMTSYFYQVDNGIRADVLFNYDLWLPEDFTPHNNDGEVAAFQCLPLHDVMAMVNDGDAFKFNANLVLIDLFIRHGYLTPAHPDYEAICGLLNPRHSVLHSRYGLKNFT